MWDYYSGSTQPNGDDYLCAEPVEKSETARIAISSPVLKVGFIGPESCFCRWPTRGDKLLHSMTGRLCHTRLKVRRVPGLNPNSGPQYGLFCSTDNRVGKVGLLADQSGSLISQ